VTGGAVTGDAVTGDVVNLDHLAGKGVLVTGASGFVGGDLLAALRADGRIAVRALVRRRGALDDRFAEAGDALETVVGDLARPESLKGICEGIDSVFHCAAMGMAPSAAAATALSTSAKSPPPAPSTVSVAAEVGVEARRINRM